MPDAAKSKPTSEPEQPSGEKPYEASALRRAPSLVLVNTGDGKGKSSAAFGVVLRSVARGWPVAVVQFLKSGNWHTGEERVCRDLGVEFHAAGDGFTWDSTDMDETRSKAVAAWAHAASLIAAGDHRLLVFDEISYAMTWGWIDSTEVASVVKARPEHVNIVLTGRDMADAVIAVADTVTEMRNVKHAFDSNIRAMKGIDY